VQFPPPVKLQRKRVQLDELEHGQVFEQRICRRGRQDRVAGIAQQLEQKRICLTGRGCDHDVRRIAIQLACDRFSCADDAQGLRVVRLTSGARHRVAELVERIGQRDPRRIRNRQIEQPLAASKSLFARERQGVDGSAPVGAP